MSFFNRNSFKLPKIIKRATYVVFCQRSKPLTDIVLIFYFVNQKSIQATCNSKVCKCITLKFKNKNASNFIWSSMDICYSWESACPNWRKPYEVIFLFPNTYSSLRCRKRGDMRGSCSPCHFLRGQRGKGGKGEKGARSALPMFTFLFWWHSYLLPHVLSRFEEMHINFAITVEERDKIFFVKSCAFASFRIFDFNWLILPSTFQRKPAPPPPCALKPIRHRWFEQKNYSLFNLTRFHAMLMRGF